MGIISEPTRVLPITGILYGPGCVIEEPLSLLAEKIGPIALHTAAVPFTHTAYYTREMGDPILRQWYAFDTLIDPAALVAMKHMSNEIEREYSHEQGGRSVNIDPGIISLSNLILASTKNYAHRIYLGKGIYAELTLVYRDKHFQALEWTYPDYQEPAALAFFDEARSFLKTKLGHKHRRQHV